MAKNRRYTDAPTIASGATVSSTITLEGSRILLAIQTPSSLTGTAFTFQGSLDGSNFYALYDEGSVYSVNVGTSRYIALKRQVFDSVPYVKIVSGSSEAALRTLAVVSGE